MTHTDGDYFYSEKIPDTIENNPNSNPNGNHANHLSGDASGLKKIDAEQIMNYIERIDNGENVFKNNYTSQGDTA